MIKENRLKNFENEKEPLLHGSNFFVTLRFG